MSWFERKAPNPPLAGYSWVTFVSNRSTDAPSPVWVAPTYPVSTAKSNVRSRSSGT
jgi:hypothetical protein